MTTRSLPRPVTLLAIAGVSMTHLVAQQLASGPSPHLAAPVGVAGLAAAVITGRGATWSLTELLRVQQPVAVLVEVVAHARLAVSRTGVDRRYWFDTEDARPRAALEPEQPRSRPTVPTPTLPSSRS